MGKPRHQHARRFVEQGLFAGLRRFRDLERRIAALPTEGDRGHAFEVLAEAYLATQPIQKAKHIWPSEAIPHSARKELQLHATDVGADGLIETQSGAHRAYQVKFRTGRPALTWREVSTFFGVTDRCDERLLFTNCNELSEVSEERRDFSSIRGTDLDRLGPGDFAAIRAWLAGTKIVRRKKTPRPHQQVALRAVIPFLRRRDRATVVMACGTGKTQVALWAAEAVAHRTVLVLVPSLALLRQTLKEWVNETKWKNYDYLCVCSDPTVSRGDDALVIRPTELEFSVSTDPLQVRRFLRRPFGGTKIVFSTYQSAQVVAKAMSRQDIVDIGIFDEAHKTAGREGAKFSFALNDRNLRISKRLFLTATPRHYNIQDRDAQGEPVEVYSMDRPEVYGPVVHTLGFAEAAKDGIICRYKVLISVVTSRMLGQHDLRHGRVQVKGDEVHASQVANQIALSQAVRKHGLKRIFTFHRTVDSARSFTADASEGVQNHLKHFAAFHVRGTMPTAERDGIMDEFRAAPKAVMSNARCLTEGIDVPAVDLVAFLTPKRSKVDIVQATGRAMRKDPANKAKTTGYILVPLYVEQARGETIEQAVSRAEFDEVWAVLQAMQEQDELLDNSVHFVLAGGKRIRGFDEQRMRERVEVIGPSLSINTLRRVIATRCVERLGRPWDVMVQQLLLFKKKFGHLRVPLNAPRPWKDLAFWVDHVRALRRNGHLTPEREAQLAKMGFVWRVEGQTLDDTRGLFSEAQFRRASGLWMVAEYRDRGLIKPVGKGMSASKLSHFYHPRQIKELRKKLGITLDDTRGLLSEKQFGKASGLTRVADYRKQGQVKPVGQGISKAGLSYFYHPRQVKELTKRLGITLDDTRGLLNEAELRKASRLSKVEEYRKRGLIMPIGRAVTRGGVSYFYHHRQIKELRKKLGITLIDTRGLLSEKQFGKASGLTRVAKYRKQGLIKPVGQAISHAGLSYFYHPRQIKELRKKLGITLDDTRGLLNEGELKKASRLSMIKKYREQGLIRPLGKAMAGPGISYFYHPRQVKELKRKLGPKQAHCSSRAAV